MLLYWMIKYNSLKTGGRKCIGERFDPKSEAQTANKDQWRQKAILYLYLKEVMFLLI